MNTAGSTNPYTHQRFPAEIISHGVWLSCRFCLSSRDVEERLFARGVLVTSEAIQQWCRKFGQQYAHQLRRRRPRPGDKWHLDEGFLTINGARHDLWRAVDQDGHGLDMLVHSRRHKNAAKQFCRTLLKGLTDVPRVIITDQLKSDGAAKQDILPGVAHRQHRYLNNRAENSHQPTRQRERRMQGCVNPPGLRHASSPRLAPWRNTSGHDAIACPRLHTAKRCSKDSRGGVRSRARGGLPQSNVGPRLVRSRPSVAPRRDQHE